MIRSNSFFSIAFFALFPIACLAADDQATAMHGTPTIDGELDDVWKTTASIDVKKPIEGLLTIDRQAMSTSKVRLLWDTGYLYAFWEVADSKLSSDSFDDWAQDSVELFIDQNHEASVTYQSDDAQYRVNYEGKVSGQGPGYDEGSVKAVTKKTETGYVVEMSIAMPNASLTAGKALGVELQVNNDDGSGERVSIAKWNHAEDDSWENTANFGTLTLKK